MQPILFCAVVNIIKVILSTKQLA